MAFSQSTKLPHETLDYFVETGNHECFVALLYVAYGLIKYDYVMELSWLHDLGTFIKPYEISIAYENKKKLDEMHSELQKRNAENTEQTEHAAGQPLMITNGSMMGLGYQPTGAGFGNSY